MTLLLALLAQLLHGALVLLAAPLLAGGARWLRLRLAGRRGAPPWQEWRDLRRLVVKQPNLPEDASALSRILPYASFATALAAAGLLVFVDCMKELSATLLLRPLNFETLATHLYGEAARGTYEEAAIAALAIVVVGILPVILLARVGRGIQ
mgnify:CR=1 FL=1